MNNWDFLETPIQNLNILAYFSVAGKTKVLTSRTKDTQHGVPNSSTCVCLQTFLQSFSLLGSNMVFYALTSDRTRGRC